MDVSLSSKPQILTLFSCNHFSSASSFLSSPSKLPPFGTEFLGCGHNLRPPGGGPLRCHRRNRKLPGPHFYTTRFRFRASLGASHSVIVVAAVVTFSDRVLGENQNLRLRVGPKPTHHLPRQAHPSSSPGSEADANYYSAVSTWRSGWVGEPVVDGEDLPSPPATCSSLLV